MTDSNTATWKEKLIGKTLLREGETMPEGMNEFMVGSGSWSIAVHVECAITHCYRLGGPRA